MPNLAAIMAKTPLYILKGIVEMTDPNILISSKMVMAAELLGKEFPGGSLGAALSLLPITVFPPPPFGPGIGPPITPPGFIYLALDGIRTPYEKAKKNLSKKNQKAAEKLEEEIAERAAEEAANLAAEAEARGREALQPPSSASENAEPAGSSEIVSDDPCD
jgi:hypothetical protein